MQEVYDQLFTVEKNFTVIDVGAHAGIYSIRAAKKVGENGLVIAVEPHPDNYKSLIQNIAINNLRNVIPVRLALADFEGRTKLHLSLYPREHSITHSMKGNHIIVPVSTIAHLLKKLNVKNVDLIKIDAEGAELKILLGAKELLRSQRIRITTAAYHTSTQAKEIEDYLKSNGFEVNVLKLGENFYVYATNL